MNLLVDACVGREVVQALRMDGHDVDYVCEWNADPGDETILRRAGQEHRAIITRDKDFGSQAVLLGIVHFGIVQVRKIPLRDHASACRTALRKHEADLAKGAIVTVQPGRIRVRHAGP